jgi:signal transduction histidine kinase
MGSQVNIQRPETWQQERARLLELLAEHESEITMLTSELEETNRGVVALYAEIDDKAEQLRHVSELKSRFLSYLSHEFRTPLGSIRSMSRLLLDRMDGPLTEEQERQIEFVQTAAVELTDMVNDLLDLAKVEAGRITVAPAWFEMVDLFSALRGMFKPIVHSTTASLIFEEPHGIPRIYTDRTKLSQILRNFIANALKFTPEGEVRVSACHDGEWVTFSVRDTGIGIAAEHLTLLFQDFTQIDNPVQRRLRGSGLGLSLSKKFAELLGGSVHVESEVGVGSLFHARIPIRLPGATEIEAEGEADR